MPVFSVIIPSYNRAHLIGRAIRSVLLQTFQDYEIMVVDDGSTDNTEETVKGFNDSRIRYIRHHENKGAAASWNTGIKASSGKYIAFLDSDDEWLEKMLEKQFNAFESSSSEVGVVYTGLWQIKKGEKIYHPVMPELKQKDVDIHKLLLRKNFTSTPSTGIRRDCLLDAGLFDESIPRYQQWDLMIRISKTYKFLFIDEPLMINYPQPDSLSANSEKTIQGWDIVFKKHYEEFTCDKSLLAFRYFDVGSDLLLKCSDRRGKKYFFKAIAAAPFDLRMLRHCIFVILFGIKPYLKAKKIYANLKDTITRCKKSNAGC